MVPRFLREQSKQSKQRNKHFLEIEVLNQVVTLLFDEAELICFYIVFLIQPVKYSPLNSTPQFLCTTPQFLNNNGIGDWDWGMV